MTDPITSGSKNLKDQPPWVNPPLVSSSAPPGACTTPSRLMNSLATTRMICLHSWTGSLCSYYERAWADSKWSRDSSASPAGAEHRGDAVVARVVVTRDATDP